MITSMILWIALGFVVGLLAAALMSNLYSTRPAEFLLLVLASPAILLGFVVGWISGKLVSHRDNARPADTLLLRIATPTGFELSRRDRQTPGSQRRQLRRRGTLPLGKNGGNHVRTQFRRRGV